MALPMLRNPRPFVAAAAAIFLIPWIGYLELVLPTHYEAYHWRGAWVGFDVGLLAFLLATAVLGFRRSHLLSVAAFTTGVLLLVDVWFDITTASPHDRITSIITAAIGNIPLALILTGVGVQMLRRIHKLAERGLVADLIVERARDGDLKETSFQFKPREDR